MLVRVHLLQIKHFNLNAENYEALHYQSEDFEKPCWWVKMTSRKRPASIFRSVRQWVPLCCGGNVSELSRRTRFTFEGVGSGLKLTSGIAVM
jgi:hypothetical protein